MTSPHRDCPDDGTLLLYLDGALDRSAETELRAHLSGCGACAERLSALRRRSEEVREWVTRHDPEPPPREAYDFGRRGRSDPGPRWRRRWAAAAVIVLALGALVSPVRGLLVEHVLDNVREWISGVGPGESHAGGETATTDPVEDTASPATAFAWSGPEVTLRFVSEETRVRLTLLPAADSLVTLWSVRVDVPLGVQRGTVALDNRASPAGEYRLAVPAHVSTVRVRIGDGGEWAIPVGELRVPRTVALSKPSPSGGSMP